MQRQSANLSPTTAIPTISDIRRVWRADHCVCDSSASIYLLWIRRFRAYCTQRKRDEPAELTLAGANRFIRWYARRRHLNPSGLSGARTALSALTRVYQVMGRSLPDWQSPRVPHRPRSAVLRAFADHLAHQRGNPPVTVGKKLDHVTVLREHLAQRGKTWRQLTLRDIDEYLVECSSRYARSTTADVACSIRAFVRFLHTTGRISVDLAESVIAPVQRKYERPRRALPWDDVQHLIQSVDKSSARGLRDHALLLLMCTYGFGAGEVIGLQLDDIDWTAGTLTAIRPKTGFVFTVPLLPAVAEVLARYLRESRPPKTPTRHLFVRMKMPFSPLSGSSAVRHILIKHAAVAGIHASYLGSHVLRYSNAARQLAIQTPPQTLSQLLGHRDPESVSAYLRIDTQALREVSLPVPR